MEEKVQEPSKNRNVEARTTKKRGGQEPRDENEPGSDKFGWRHKDRQGKKAIASPYEG